MVDTAPESSSRRSHPLTLAGKIVGGIVLFLALAVIGVALLPESFWKWLITREIHAETGRTASIDGRIHAHLLSWTPELALEGLTISNAEWARHVPLLTLKRFDVSVRLAPLLRGEIVIPQLLIEEPRIDIERDRSERVNFDITPPKERKAKPSKPAQIPVIQQLRLINGNLSVIDEVMKLRFDGSLGIEAAADSPGIGALNVHGKGTLNAKPFELAVDGEPLLKVDHDHPYDFQTHLRAADIKLDAQVSIHHPFDLGSLQAKFDISGADLADVYYLTALALPNTPPYQVSGTLNRDGQNYRIEDFRGRLGSSDIAGKIGIDMSRERPKLTAALDSKELRLADLAAPLGAPAPDAEKATVKPNPNPKAQKAPPPPTPEGTGLVLPDADLQVDRVRAMDADVTFNAASILTAKMPVQKLSFRLRLDAGLLRLDPLAFTLPQGQLSGAVGIDARGATPQTDLDMKLSHVNLGTLKPKDSNSPPVVSGDILGRIKLHGVGSSVHKAAESADGDITLVVPKGEINAALAELTGINLRGIGLFLTKKDANAEVRCGAVNLHAENGDFKANTFLFDTTDVRITGKGHVEMTDERLDFIVGGQPKKVRLVRLRTPITVKGTLLHPKIGVEVDKAVEQAGAAAALGALLTPFAAALAFVDGGLAKNADCAALLSQTEQGHDLQAAKP